MSVRAACPRRLVRLAESVVARRVPFVRVARLVLLLLAESLTDRHRPAGQL